VGVGGWARERNGVVGVRSGAKVGVVNVVGSEGAGAVREGTGVVVDVVGGGG
jgi:hypothetical protein